MTNQSLPNTLTILLGFGGSGGKTIRKLAELMTNDPESARFADERVHVILCDTDEGDLRRSEREIADAFDSRCPGMSLKVETFSLASSSDIFCDLVEGRFGHLSPEGRSRMREHWWFNQGTPFSATGLPLATSAGAGQCPLVSHFLAWEQLDRFPEVLERIDAIAKNERHMENYSIDLVMVAGLAGGTGRGCWQALSFKAREHFGRSGQSCRPYGFFFDQSVFADIQRGRPEQKVKLQINSLTGLSELAMWLRSDRRMPGDPAPTDTTPPERRFRLPSFQQPENSGIDVLDTDRYMPEGHFARVGRSPIHKAYVFTNESSSMRLEKSDRVYELCAAAIYGRILVGQMRSSDANQPARAAATATSILYVPASDIRKLIVAASKQRRCEHILLGTTLNGAHAMARAANGRFTVASDEVRTHLKSLTDWITNLLEIPTVDTLRYDEAEALRVGKTVANQLALQNRQATLSDPEQKAFDNAIYSGDETRANSEFNRFVQPPSEGSNEYVEALRVALDIRDDEWAALGKDARTTNQQLDVLAAQVLSRLASGHKASLQRLCGGSGNSIALAEHVARELLEIVNRLSVACVAERNGITGSTSAGSAFESEYKKKVNRVFKFLRKAPFGKKWFRAVSPQSKAALYERAAQERRIRWLPQLLDQHQDFLSKLKVYLEIWQRNCELAVREVGAQSALLQRAVDKEVEGCFTKVHATGDGRVGYQPMLEQLLRDDLSPGTRMLRRLRPIYSKERFDALVNSTLAERRGVDDQQAVFVEQLLGRDASALRDEQSMLFTGQRSSITESHRFRRSIEERLQTLLSKQDASDNAVDQFTLRAVLQELMENWIHAYTQNRGDDRFCKQLDEAVSNITGISIKALEESARNRRETGHNTGADIAPPSEAELMAHASLRLAAKCDPLVRMPEPTGASGDLVCVFVPDSTRKTPRDTTEDIRKTVDQLWENWKGEFRHVRAERLVDNPFMLIATSDHPKRDFDQKGWSGWSSFDYHYLETDLTNWLEWVEDPTGKSIFLQGKDDSIGLGYIHPAYVRDQHWARRRWRPWFNENRQKTQDRRKWEALAYALLGNEMYAESEKTPVDASTLPFLERYHQVCRAIAGWEPVNPDFPTERWTMPLIRENAGGGGPRFTRRMFRVGPTGIRLDGSDLTESGACKSVRSFMEWFKSDESRDALNEIYAEQCLFGRTVNAREKELYDVLSPEHRQDVRKTLHEFVRRWRDYVKRFTKRSDDCAEQVAFLDEFEKVLADPNFDVLRPFDGVTTTD